MAQKYEVQYDIHVNSEAAQKALDNFGRSVNALQNLKMPNLSGLVTAVNMAHDAARQKMATPLALDVDSEEATFALEYIETQLKEIRKQCKVFLNLRTRNAKLELYEFADELAALDAIADIDLRVKNFDKVKKDLQQLRSLANLSSTVALDDKKNKKNKTDIDSLSQVERERLAIMDSRIQQLNKLLNIDTSKVGELKQMGAALRSINHAIKKQPEKPYEPKVQVTNAIKSLDLLQAKIQTIRDMAHITITTSAAGASSVVPNVNNNDNNSGSNQGGGSNQDKGKGKGKGGGKGKGKRALTANEVFGHTYVGSGTNIVSDVVKGMGVSYGFSMLTSGIANAFKDASNYENISTTTSNILKANDSRPDFDARFAHVNEVMRKVGVETKFTAPEVASAGKFLAMAGYQAEDIAHAINPISDIALIGDTELGETADVVTNIMTAYEIPAAEMNRVADILTMTFTNTNTTLMEMAEAFKYAGTVARQAGLSFEQTSAAVGILGDAGIKASQAGTTIRMMLLNFLNPTKSQKDALGKLGISAKDEYGNLKDFVTLMQEINEVSKSGKFSQGEFTSHFYKAFRVTASSGALALVRHADKLAEVTRLNRDESYGLAGQLADKKKNTIEGLVHQIESAFTEGGMQGFERLQSEIRSFLNRIVEMLKTPEFVEALSSGMKTVLEIGQRVADMLQAFTGFWNMIPDFGKTAFVWFGMLQVAINGIAGGIKTILSTLKFFKGFTHGSWIGWFAGRKKRGGATGGAGDVADDVAEEAAEAAAPTLFSAAKAHPYIAASLAAMAAIGTGALVLHNHWKKVRELTEAATEANKKYTDSLKTSGVFDMDLSKPYALAIGNMRIFNNQMLSQQERISSSIKLWREYWDALHGVGSKKPADTSALYSTIENPAAQTVEANRKLQDETWFFHTTGHMLQQIKERGGVESGKITKRVPGLGDVTQTTYKFPDGSVFVASGHALKDWKKWNAYLAGHDPNNPLVSDAEGALRFGMQGSASVKDFEATMASIQSKHIKDASVQLMSTSNQWTINDAFENETARPIINAQIRNKMNAYNSFLEALKSEEQGKHLDSAAFTNLLTSMGVAPVLLPQNTEIGSQDWLNQVQQNMQAEADEIQNIDDANNFIKSQLTELHNFMSTWSAVKKYGWNKLINTGQLMEAINKLQFQGSKVEVGADHPLFAALGLGSVATGAEGTTVTGGDTTKNSGTDQSSYKSHYNTSSAPKQVIVNIENLMRVDRQEIDMNDSNQVAAINNIKQELATALLDVVQDFNANMR